MNILILFVNSMHIKKFSFLVYLTLSSLDFAFYMISINT